jgi:hypothetical protein
MPRLSALSITPTAEAWLADTRAARVLSAFGRACNLVNPDGAVLALTTQAVGLTPFALQVSAPAPRPFGAVTADTAVAVQPGLLTLGDLQIVLSGAALWDPRPDWPAINRALTGDAASLGRLQTLALTIGKPGSLLDLFTREPGTAAEARAWQGAHELIDGLSAQSLERSLAGAGRLAGLGGGLTPAGDDFIVGALLAAWAGLLGAGVDGLFAPVADAAAQATTTLSGAYLHAATRARRVHGALASAV